MLSSAPRPSATNTTGGAHLHRLGRTLPPPCPSLDYTILDGRLGTPPRVKTMSSRRGGAHGTRASMIPSQLKFPAHDAPPQRAPLPHPLPLTSPIRTVLEHLEQRQRRNVHGFSCVHHRRVWGRAALAMEKMLQLLHRDGSGAMAQGGRSRRVPRKQSTGAVTTSLKSKNDHQQYGKTPEMESATQARQDRVVGASGSPKKTHTVQRGSVARTANAQRALWQRECCHLRHATKVHSVCNCPPGCQCLSAGTP